MCCCRVIFIFIFILMVFFGWEENENSLLGLIDQSWRLFPFDSEAVNELQHFCGHRKIKFCLNELRNLNRF